MNSTKVKNSRKIQHELEEFKNTQERRDEGECSDIRAVKIIIIIINRSNWRLCHGHHLEELRSEHQNTNRQMRINTFSSSQLGPASF